MARERLLVVDDEEPIRRLFEDYFTELGYEVVTAGSGRDALDKVTPGIFDGVLCDLMLPEMDGLAILKEFRSIDPKAMFFMMTGYPSVESAITAIQLGAYDYITKPVNLEDVRYKIERAMKVRAMEKSLRKTSGFLWAVLVSVPLWIIVGIIVGLVLRKI
jgi:DNA-binding NtrC family response regulator